MNITFFFFNAPNNEDNILFFKLEKLAFITFTDSSPRDNGLYGGLTERIQEQTNRVRGRN